MCHLTEGILSPQRTHLGVSKYWGRKPMYAYQGAGPWDFPIQTPLVLSQTTASKRDDDDDGGHDRGCEGPHLQARREALRGWIRFQAVLDTCQMFSFPYGNVRAKPSEISSR